MNVALHRERMKLCNWLRETCLYMLSFFHYLSLSLSFSISDTESALLCFAMASRPRTRRMGVESTDKRERRCKYPTRDPETFFKIVLNEKILVCIFCSLKLFWVILWFSVLFLNETLWVSYVVTCKCYIVCFFE